MKRQLCYVMLLLPIISWASAPTEVQEITPQNAKSLGFSVLIEVESEATIVRLSGPAIMGEDCFASSSGAALMDSDGNELMVHTTRLETWDSGPNTHGYYMGTSNIMSVWLSYICSENPRDSRRYVIESVADYVVARVQPDQR